MKDSVNRNTRGLFIWNRNQKSWTRHKDLHFFHVRGIFYRYRHLNCIERCNITGMMSKWLSTDHFHPLVFIHQRWKFLNEPQLSGSRPDWHQSSAAHTGCVAKSGCFNLLQTPKWKATCSVTHMSCSNSYTWTVCHWSNHICIRFRLEQAVVMTYR